MHIENPLSFELHLHTRLHLLRGLVFSIVDNEAREGRAVVAAVVSCLLDTQLRRGRCSMPDIEALEGLEFANLVNRFSLSTRPSPKLDLLARRSFALHFSCTTIGFSGVGAGSTGTLATCSREIEDSGTGSSSSTSIGWLGWGKLAGGGAHTMNFTSSTGLSSSSRKTGMSAKLCGCGSGSLGEGGGTVGDSKEVMKDGI